MNKKQILALSMVLTMVVSLWAFGSKEVKSEEEQNPNTGAEVILP